jgi:Uma2 family endonuclease
MASIVADVPQESVSHPLRTVAPMLTTIDEDALVAQVEEEHYAMAGAAHHNFVIRLYEGLLTVFHDRDDVCVLAEVTSFGPEGQPFIPDVAVIHGVPQTEPTSWRQDRGDPPATVVIEVVSRSENDDMVSVKLARFNEFGIDEVWLLRISTGEINCYRRVDGSLRRDHDNTSALLGGVRFESGPDGSIVPLFADGEEFPSHFVVILARAHRAEARAEQAEARIETAEARIETAEARIETAEARVATAEAQAERLRAQLREAGITPSG